MNPVSNDEPGRNGVDRSKRGSSSRRAGAARALRRRGLVARAGTISTSAGSTTCPSPVTNATRTGSPDRATLNRRAAPSGCGSRSSPQTARAAEHGGEVAARVGEEVLVALALAGVAVGLADEHARSRPGGQPRRQDVGRDAEGARGTARTACGRAARRARRAGPSARRGRRGCARCRSAGRGTRVVPCHPPYLSWAFVSSLLVSRHARSTPSAHA